MSKLSTQPYKGTRDFYPEDMRIRKWMFDKWRKVSEQFGYEEIDGPILEPLELYTAKTSEEIVNEQTYSFTDRGDRKVVMRPEMTPTVSRMVAARRQELAYPLRVYNIPNCFRYERPQKGRLREFWQYNADIFGIARIDADLEIIMLSDTLLKEFGATEDMFSIRINSRTLLDKAMEAAGSKDNAATLRYIDKKDKLDAATFEKGLAELVDDPKLLNESYLEANELSDVAAQLQETEEFIALQTLFDKLRTAGVTSARFVPAVARGFDYYTDIVFEVFDENPENNRSMYGGGRYDGLVGEFGVEPIPTVGFAMGDVTFLNFLKANNLLPDLEPETRVYIAIASTEEDMLLANTLVGGLRQAGLNVAVDFSDRKIDKQLASAYKKGINQVVIVEDQAYTLRDLTTKENQTLTDQEIVQLLTK